MLIDIIAGARPNFMKIAPIISAIKKEQKKGKIISFRLIHTGQHYDAKMSGDFFKQLEIPDPDFNLNIGSGSQAEQTGAIMIAYEKLMLENVKPDFCLVVGDVTSTLATSITAKKLNVKVVHVEAGIRSGDITMPEEINRLVTDAITDYFFTTTPLATENLLRSGLKDNQIFFVGNTMIDTLLKHLPNFKAPDFYSKFQLTEKNYLVITLHRPSNVDRAEDLEKLVNAIIDASRNLKIVFPVHPRTAKILAQIKFDKSKMILVDPMSYLEFNYLVKNAKAVITDSGGITEETTVLGVPCMTLRTSTERPETCEIGTNELLGTDPDAIKPALDLLFVGSWKKGEIPELWDGKSAERIIAKLIEIAEKNLLNLILK